MNANLREDMTALVEGLVLTAMNGDPNVCGCGESMDKHSPAMECGHDPVSYYQYTIDNACTTFSLLLSRPKSLVTKLVRSAIASFERKRDERGNFPPEAVKQLRRELMQVLE